MARLPKTREAKTGDIPKGYLRKRATGAEKVEYNVHKIATKVFAPPKPAKKSAAKKPAAKKKGKKISATYLTLVKRALKKLVTKEKQHAGVSVPTILKYLFKNFPEKSDRKRVTLALVKGVANKTLVQTRRRFRLSAKELKKASKKKTTKKATGTKRKSTKEGDKKSATKKAKTTKKVATKKSTTKKAATKKSTTKKAATKKSTTKKSGTKKATTKKTATKKTATKKPATKKTTTKKASTKKVAPKAVSHDIVEESRGTIAEGGVGKWQYYDNGWHDYYPDASTVVEGVYQEYKTNTNLDVRAVKSGHFQYSIDFSQLQQKNIETGTVRNIKRVLA